MYGRTYTSPVKGRSPAELIAPISPRCRPVRAVGAGSGPVSRPSKANDIILEQHRAEALMYSITRLSTLDEETPRMYEHTSD